MSILEQLQLDIAARLDASLPTIPVRALRLRSNGSATQIIDEINSALEGLLEKNGHRGAAILVEMPEAKSPNPDIPGPLLDVTVDLHIVEVPLFNMGDSGTLLSAEDIALIAARLLHHHHTGVTTLCVDRDALRPVNDVEGAVIYDLRLAAKIGLDIAPVTATPVISRSGSLPSVTITLSGEATSDLSYTLDGAYPLGAQSIAYVAPFVVAVPLTVRAAAVVDGKNPSDIAMLQIET